MDYAFSSEISHDMFSTLEKTCFKRIEIVRKYHELKVY